MNFSDGPVKFRKHEQSSGHFRAVENYALRQAASESVSCSLGSERAKKVLNFLLEFVYS